MISRNKRPSWDEYFMMMAEVAKKRADCTRRQVGAIVVRDFRIISTGYNGTPHKIKNCSEGGCLRCQRRDRGEIKGYEYEESCVCIHAEQNAIIQAGLHGINIADSTIYCTHSPCILCAKMLVNCKIKKFVTSGDYADKSFKALFREAGVGYRVIKQPKLIVTKLD